MLTNPANQRSDAHALDFLSGGGEMEQRILAFDWSRTALGPLETWPQSLKTALKIALNSRYPIWMGWGRELVNLYNTPYIPVLGKRDEWALGASARDVWKEVWEEHLGPQADAVLLRGEASWNDQRQMIMYRNGYAEETYFTFSFSPLPADEGGIGGLFCACTEDTQKVLGERRLAALRHLAAATADARTEEAAADIAARTLAEHNTDVSFALIYLNSLDGATARLAPGSRNLHDVRWAPPEISLIGHGDAGDTDIWPLRQAMDEGMQVLQNIDPKLGLPGGRWPEATATAAVVPLAKAGHAVARGFLVVGASPRLPFDENYRSFFELLARGTADALSNARAYEEERMRAEALAELDRAKTAFFSNVSHEFRTPLTLMLGPVEELLSKSHTDLSPSAKGQLEVVNRNGLRLLRLVNSLLDFSRIEAGRVQACYEATDLSTFTAELTSSFRSATERAGLILDVDCPPLDQPAYVDRDMWEKIVLNLLSNAFKFTFEGTIGVAVRQREGVADLIVRDTGVGIPAEAMPRLFERFYRVANMRSRTHEGSGIGLALVQELARLHGGSVRATSAMGEGTTFIVTVPLGKNHLPERQVGSRHSQTSTAMGAAPFVEEALRWLPDVEQSTESQEVIPGHENLPVSCPSGHDDDTTDRPSILVVDDNADMRQYIARLLRERYRIELAADGEAALSVVRQRRPDLILSDVMMPRLDGLGLVRELRGDPMTQTIPVILLSARAGEESRIEGLEHGADDYLIKPFSARELLARVQAHLDMARLRRETAEKVTHILSSITDGFQVIDAGWRFTEFNIAAKRTFAEQGIDAATLIGKHVFDEAFPDAVDNPGALALRRTMVERISTEVETFYAPWQRWFSVRHYPTHDGGVATFFHDITERKRSEQEIRNQAEQFETLLNQAPLGVYLVDADFRIAQVNPIARPVFGDIPDLIGRNFDEVIHLLWEKRYADEIVDIFRHTLETGESYLTPERAEFRIDRGVTEYYEWRLDRITLPDGCYGLVCYFRDISAQVQARERIRESEARFRIMADVSPVIIWVTDATGGIEFINQAYRDFCGVTDEEVRERRWQMVVHPEDREQYVGEFVRCVRDRKPFYARCRIKRVDGVWRWIASYGAPRFSGEGQFLGHVGSSPDIQDMQEAQERLKSWNVELEQAVNEKTAELQQSQERLRAMASELNLAEQRERKRLATELHDHLQQMLVFGKLTIGQSKRHVEDIPVAAEALKNVDTVLSDALSYSRTLVAELSPPVLRDHGMAAGLKWLAEYIEQKHGQCVTVIVPEGEGLKLPEDQRILLFQSVRELLINAAKHAGTGAATVKMIEREDKVQIQVRDEGRGFDLAAAAAAAAAAAGIPSGGISSKFGLFSIQERMRALGGSFDIQSVPGGGTTATLVLPVKKQPVERKRAPESGRIESAALAPDQSGGTRIRVLLVDDHIMVRQGLRAVLDAYADIELVGEAGDGEEAVGLVDERHPDVVVMDISMPKMNGIDATRQIKLRYPKTIIIGLSVNAAGENQESMERAGAIRLMTKEAAVEQLYDAIHEARRQRACRHTDVL